MARTYTNLLIHIIFSTKERAPVLTPQVREKLFPYISGIIRNIESTPIAIGGVADHVHILLALPPKIALSNALKEIKGSSSHWLNEERLITGKFEWQSGFGAYSVSESAKKNVISYINDQEQHHRKMSFAEEYETYLKKNGIEYHPDYWLG